MTVLVHSIRLRALALFSGIGVAIIAVVLVKFWNEATAVAGIMSAMFIVYGLFVAWNTERVRRQEDADALEDVKYQVVRCVGIVEMIAQLVDEAREDEALRALFHLSDKASLLVTRYRKYLMPQTALEIKEIEAMIVDVQVCGTDDLRWFVGAIGRRFRSIRGGVRDIDDPFLHRARRAI